MEYRISSYERIKYVIRYPDGYEAGKKYPVLFYIHGAGGRGDNIDVIHQPIVIGKRESANIMYQGM